jgi:hypothetical protein
MSSSAVSTNDLFREDEAPERESDVRRIGIEGLRDRLPRSWSLEARGTAEVDGTQLFDAELRLESPDGADAIVLIEAKRLINTRDVPIVMESLQRTASAWSSTQVVLPMMMARYLPPTTRERIAAAGAGYADATGNLLLACDRPALFLRDRGADRDPWRGPGRPRGTLKGVPATRVVRALVDFAPPYTVPELAERAGASTGATYRVVEFLDGEGLLQRQRYGPISDVKWRPLLERWSHDYGFLASNTVQTFLEPRGVSALTERLAQMPELQYVVTGSLARGRVAAYAPARLATLYVRDLRTAAEALQLRPVDSGTNVALAAGKYDVVFERAELFDGVRMAAASQVAVDLLTGPGRNPSEAVAMLEWMERNERVWRR